MKKVLVNAFTEFNLGDDLLIKILFERYPNVLFYLNAKPEYKIFCKQFPNVRVVELNKFSILKRIFFKLLFPLREFYVDRKIHQITDKVDCYVHIGGSLFMQNINNSLSGKDYFNAKLNKALNKKPKFIIGANFGPYKSESYRSFYESIFNEYYDVCFRDNLSLTYFENKKNKRVAPDAVFNLNIERKQKIINSVGFSLMDFTKANTLREYSDIYKDKIIEIVNIYLNLDYSVFMFSFYKNNGDFKVIKDIISEIEPEKRKRIKHISYEGDIDFFISEYSKVERMFCTRFHSLILSIICGQKFYPIAYSGKMVSVLEDMGYTGTYSTVSELGKIVPEKVVHEIEKNFVECQNLSNKSINQFKELDKTCLI